MVIEVDIKDLHFPKGTRVKSAIYHEIGLNREYFWDGEEDPRYEYNIQGVVVGKDGKPKRKK